MRKSLTSKFIENIKAPGSKRLEVWDTVLPCFGMRVSPNGRKTWFVTTRHHGRVHRVTIGTYPAISLAEARERARKKIGAAQLGIPSEEPEIEQLTLAQAIPVFIRMYAKPKNRRWKATERILTKFKALNHKPLDEIKRSDVVRVLDRLIASEMTTGANRALSALKKLLNWALDRGMIQVNPIIGLKPPAQEKARERVLTDDELKMLIETFESETYPFGAMLKALLLTAQRRGEVSGMRWSEIDFKQSVWTITCVSACNFDPLTGVIGVQN